MRTQSKQATQCRLGYRAGAEHAIVGPAETGLGRAVGRSPRMGGEVDAVGAGAHSSGRALIAARMLSPSNPRRSRKSAALR
jgi:hypothetical protein